MMKPFALPNLPTDFNRMTQQDIVAQLLKAINLEEQEQMQRFRLDEQHSLKSLKAEGLALHPINVQRKSFGYADYPEIGFRLPFPAETSLFKDGAAIECFITGEEPVKGVLLDLDNNAGSFRLFAPDFPDWIEDAGVGIKLSPDQRTTALMKDAMHRIEKNPALLHLFETIHFGDSTKLTLTEWDTRNILFQNKSLNDSQQQAIVAILQNDLLCIVHGPPGTGKTTTLAEGIVQLVNRGEKVMVAAPSNTAIDHMAGTLLRCGLNILRVGNPGKTDASILAHTPEGKMQQSNQQKEIKQLKIRAEEFRKMALKYKRSFGKAEREQRQLLFKEVKSIRTAIKELRNYYEEKLYRDADVILGTPVGLYDAGLHKLTFGTLLIDEAGQCIEPLAWSIFPLADKIVLAGDHLQLPPTVISEEAAKLGLSKSILEQAIQHHPQQYLLNIQYRMRESIAGFSSAYFYKGLLQSPTHLQNNGLHIHFIDMAGSGENETAGADGISLQNEGEISITQKLLESEGLALENTAFITPYSGQVAAARIQLPATLRISTIDSFQGQEKENIVMSLVRSNDEGIIGFLKDYRRMNVALTRAKEQLFIIGDSATIGADPFFNQLLEYVEAKGNYRSVWEFMV